MKNRLAQFFIIAGLLAAPGCVQLTLAWADLSPDGVVATPAALGPFDSQPAVTDIASWEEMRVPRLRRAFETHIYGVMPDSHRLEVIASKLVDDGAFNGAGRLSELELRAYATFENEEHASEPFYMNVVTPRGSPDAPIILMETFCPRWDTIPHPGVYRPEKANACSDGAASGIMKYIFGRYIATPPIEMILARGYGVAAIFPSEFIPDNGADGLESLAAMASPMENRNDRWGAIAAWGWGFSLMVDALIADETLNPSAYITFGHSRYGKSALLAAAFDPRISGVIAHQSGTGGASLNRRKSGESIKSITANYPHWFASHYADYGDDASTLPVDQHQLLALIAPRPILLGNARRDVWSDPNGAFRAAVGADPVYELYGAEGLDQDRLDQWKPDADIAFWIRPGTHGVVKEDWPAFLEFLSAHFPIGQDGERP